MRMADKGVYLFPSGPTNCTAACQECDQDFAEYKQAGDEVTDDIISERISEQAAQETALRDRRTFTRADGQQSRRVKDLTKVELTNSDLPRIVNGRPDDPIEKRPFSRAFSKEKVGWGNHKVGAVPLTRAALQNPKVRRELEADEDATGTVKAIAEAHALNTQACTALGLNTAVVDQQLPRRLAVVAPPTCDEEVIRKLVEGKVSQAAMWVNIGAVAFNASIVNKAGCVIVQAELDAKADKATGKLEVFKEAKDAASFILTRMRDENVVSYDDLESGEPKTLVRYVLLHSEGHDGRQQAHIGCLTDRLPERTRGRRDGGAPAARRAARCRGPSAGGDGCGHDAETDV